MKVIDQDMGKIIVPSIPSCFSIEWSTQPFDIIGISV